MTKLSFADAGTGGDRPLAAIPSPEISSFSLGPLTIHFYALCILAGVVAAVWWSERRWAAMGGEKGTIMDLAVPAVILGLIGGRIYHVVSDYQLYFEEGDEPIRALFIWEGGLGIWGAIPLGALGVWWVARKRGLSLSKLSFAIAPTIPLAQAFGRWGNYFNQELFGAPTNVPWALEVSLDARGFPRPGMVQIPGENDYYAYYHPTFLYESLWCLALAILLAWLGHRYADRLGGGRLFALYVIGYCVGRTWIEYLRVDPANEILGFRLNNFTALIVLLLALAYFVWAGFRQDRFSTRVVPISSEPGTQVIDTDPASADSPSRPGDPGESDDGSEPGGSGPQREH
ncbi:prolipoprotein diacylglyceryl transferase [Halostreptopolyspora alba]|uniref:Phosphatidylglycerol--prolipoprotein diacylglyceryl transferase n=1 Tax=Halostreptopolyspora alba TaxID=2487137 RepID=A0A3N0EFF4_9ACTN|nr:prolipoprotein diacylglyceryl transferase [Nocardiopsaceae bacterium YIM 96095]